MRRGPPDDDNGSRRIGRRRVGVADEALWHAVARTVEPLAGKPRVAAIEAPRASPPSAGPAGTSTEAKRPRSPSPVHRGPERPAGQVPAAAQRHIGRPLSPPAAPAPQVGGIERRKARRLASGSLDIERRLDLHGMRQSEAHYALVGFIRAAVADGVTAVLVITGKGGRRDVFRDAPFDDLDARDHGVLRRSVPHWLASPELRAYVVGFSTAGPRHGGSGALYVQLRRRQRVWNGE